MESLHVLVALAALFGLGAVVLATVVLHRQARAEAHQRAAWGEAALRFETLRTDAVRTDERLGALEREVFERRLSSGSLRARLLVVELRTAALRAIVGLAGGE